MTFRGFIENLPETDACILFPGGKTENGYGRVSDATRRAWLAHRYSYAVNVGPIPVGLDIDHLCRNRACVNPRHLEPVTRQENTLRGEGLPAVNAAKTHCAPFGHPLFGVNLYVDPKGKRSCRTCRRNTLRRSRARRRL